MHHHDSALVILSVVIAIFASYTALDLTSSVSTARGTMRGIWIFGGSLAMGVGIWSMHFIGMLAFSIPGIAIYYDVPLLILSILVAIFASLLALFLVSTRKPNIAIYTSGSLMMGFAIAGMHYIGIWSIRMAAFIQWNILYVGLSILIAIASSFVALLLAFQLRSDLSLRGFLYRGAGGIAMGLAIAGMHYTAMAAMNIIPTGHVQFNSSDLLATDGLAAAVIVGTLVILGIALSGSNVERALSRKTMINDALQASLRARDDFFSIASHELKTPLTSIKLQNELLIRNLKAQKFDQTKALDQLEKAAKNINRINRLVDDMLDISRMATSRLTLQKEHFDLTLLVSEVIERLQPVLQEVNSEVVFDETTRITGVWDRFRIEQVVTNLLTNAAKYAPGSPVHVSLSNGDRRVELKVSDKGKGIAPEDQDRIFKRFERAESDSDTRGLGLGLYITREILHLHGGEIKVHSRLNEGSEFIVILPV